MPRNRSEKAPRVLAERIVRPMSCAPRSLRLETDGHGGYYVWIGRGLGLFFRMKAFDEQEAWDVYEWFHEDFYFSDMRGWPRRWKTDTDAT